MLIAKRKKSLLCVFNLNLIIFLFWKWLFAQQPICYINNFNALILIFGISRSCYHHFGISIFYFKQRVNFSFECFGQSYVISHSLPKNNIFSFSGSRFREIQNKYCFLPLQQSKLR